jgi:thiol:disulfide interchange protein DsbG
MIKLKVLLIFVFIFFMNRSFAVSENSFELSDVNIDLTVSIEGVSNLELAYMKPIANTPKLDSARLPNLDTKPINAIHGSTLKLKIETVDKSGFKTDVTNDNNVKVVIAGTSVAHVCKKIYLCIWPEKPSEPRNYDPRYGTATIQILYFTPRGKSIGINSFELKSLPDPSGRSINPPLIDTKPKPSTLKTQPVTDQTWQQIKKLKGIATQSGMLTPSLYVFFDPNCPYCTDLWRTVLPVKPNTGAKPVEVQKAEFFNSVPAVWIPVAYINDTSLGKSAALMRANSHSAMDNNFQTAKYKERQGGVVAVVPTEKEKATLAHAKALWLELGGATPLMVYRNKAGSTQLFMGVPSDSQLTELLEQVSPSTLSTYSAK